MNCTVLTTDKSENGGLLGKKASTASTSPPPYTPHIKPAIWRNLCRDQARNQAVINAADGPANSLDGSP